MKILVCMTTYNEERSITTLVRAFTQEGFPVLVVDGGSIDGTVACAEQAGAMVESPAILGSKIPIGPALCRAWWYALAQNYDGVLQIDAGFSHDPTESLRFLETVREEHADLVLGSRFRPGSLYDNTAGSALRPFLSRLATTMMNFAQSGANHTDWTSGYRYFSRRALDYLARKTYLTTMHTWQIEVLAFAGAAGFTIVEVPISYVAGRSSFRFSMAWDAFRVWLNVMNHVGWVGSRLGL